MKFNMKRGIALLMAITSICSGGVLDRLRKQQ